MVPRTLQAGRVSQPFESSKTLLVASAANVRGRQLRKRRRGGALGWHLEPSSRPDAGATVLLNAHPIAGQEGPGSPRPIAYRRAYPRGIWVTANGGVHLQWATPRLVLWVGYPASTILSGQRQLS
jgi:hypothetical protein